MTRTKLTIPNYDLSDEQFTALCQANDTLRFERSPEGFLMVMEPTDGYSGNRNVKLSTELEIWNRNQESGIVFDSSTGFSLPNNAIYSPDAAWVAKERWESLTEQQKEKFPPICPDFIIELKSNTDYIKGLQQKMQHYLDCGCKLAWLIDPYSEKVYIYAQNQELTIVSFEEELDGNTVLPGFKLHLATLFKK